MTPVASALERCVGDAEAFAASHWGRRPLHRASESGFEDLLTLSDVDHILSSMSLRLPAFRLVRDGETLPSSGYTKTGRTGGTTMTGLADPARIFRLFEQGATIVLQGMHRYWLPLARFCRDLERALGHPTQVNAYITPPGSRGLAVHQDSHDVFVLQAFGSKEWEVWEKEARTGDGRGSRASIAARLDPGDSLYMPKSTPHAARTQRTLSGHLTVGVLATSWGQVVDEVVAGLKREAGFDEPLPAGYHLDLDGFAGQVARKLEELARRIEKADPREAAEARTASFLTSRPPLLRGNLEDLSRLPLLDDTSSVRRRPGAICELATRKGRLLVFLGDRELDMPARLGPVMRSVSQLEEFRIRDLAGYLDEESRLVLVRRLVREGLLEVPSGD